MSEYYIYLRKSRADGIHETVAEILARHEQILQTYAKQNLGCFIPEACILREIVSGETIQDRPAVQKLLNLIQCPECRGVLVTDPQRLSRGDMHDCGTLIRAFRYSDTQIITPVKTYALQDKFDRKLFEIELTRGNDYLEYSKEILLRGRIASVREGNYIGSCAPFGYDRVLSGKSWTLKENHESDIVRLIFSLFLDENQSPEQICRKLDMLGIPPRKKSGWSASSIRSILKNPVYAGKIRWNNRKTVCQYQNGELLKTRPQAPEHEWILTEGKHPALISEADFEAVQERNRMHSKARRRRHGLINPFAGICRCICGGAMIMQKSRKARTRLVCQNQHHCHQKSVLYEDFERTVLQILQNTIEEYIIQPEEICQNPEQKMQEKALSGIQQQIEKLCDLLERGIYTEELFLSRKKSLSDKYQSLREANPVPEQISQPLCLSMLLDDLRKPEISPESKNPFLRALIQEITYSRPDEEHIFLQINLKC